MNLTIKTKNGFVNGILENGFYSFKGIPYAKAERFQAPREYNWEGTLDCTRFGKKAMQVYDRVRPGVTPPAREEFDEDCLNLNIYVPEGTRTTDKLPVLLEIHGGGYQDGSNQGRGPESIVKDEKIIYVAINYRLGVLGYLYLGDALGEKYQTTGNNGLLDQLASVKWVYENIAAFGGDPKQITVLGASAGGKSIGSLMMLSDFNTYVNQVIVSSGATQSIRSIETSIVTTNTYLDTMRSMADELGLTKEEISGETLLTLSADDIIRVQKKFTDNPGNTCMFGPVADGVILPADWHDTAIKGTLFEGPALLGCSRNELNFYPLMNPNFVNDAPSIADALFGANSAIAKEECEELIAGYGDSITDQIRSDLWSRVLTDYMYRCYTYRLAQRLSTKKAPVWLYNVDFLPALHCSDQSLAFDAPNPMFYKEEEHRKQAEILGNRIWNAFMHFVKNGNPGEEKWLPLSPQSMSCMYWNTESTVKPITEQDVLNRFPEEVYILN